MTDLLKVVEQIADGNWHIAITNPQPWAIGPVGIGRRAGKQYAYVGPNLQLQAFQKALRSSLFGGKFIAGEVEVRIFIWRQVEDRSKSKSNFADATNMQKGIEDAIQNVLIENDKNVRCITTEVVEQSKECNGAIIIHIAPYVPKWQSEIPLQLIDALNAKWTEQASSDSESNDWFDSDGIF